MKAKLELNLMLACKGWVGQGKQDSNALDVGTPSTAVQGQSKEE